MYKRQYLFFEKSKNLLIRIGRNSVQNNVDLEIGELLLCEKKYEEAYKYLDECKSYYENRYKMKPWMTSWLSLIHI